MKKTRILFSIEDFKTDQWGKEFKKFGCEIVPNEERFYSPLKIISYGFFQKQKVDVFIFRYLNDRKFLWESLLFLLRDILIILLCKLLGTRIIWIMHNIDKETEEYYPSLSQFRRTIVEIASERIYVADPLLIEIAKQYGVEQEKLDWTCFGVLERKDPDQANVNLKRQITAFRNSLTNLGFSNVIVGLCVSAPAKKKLHFLKAHQIVGKSAHGNSCVGLIFIGDFPEGRKFERAKQKVRNSPFILFIEEAFSVNEKNISDEVDFFYRSLTDQSIAYSVYVAADLKKPMITNNTGALPGIIKKEHLGFIIDDSETDIPGFIIKKIDTWDADGARNFLLKRNWNIGAKRLMDAFVNHSNKFHHD